MIGHRQRDPIVEATAQADRRASDRASVEPQGQDKPRVIDHPQENGQPTARELTSADLLDQPALKQVARDRRDGCAGQLSAAGQISPAHRAVVVDGAKDQPRVVVARLLMGRLR